MDTGLAERVLPELPALRLEIDEHHRHKDVYQHSLTVLAQAIELETGTHEHPTGPVPGPDLVLRLAALLHDIGKPATRRFEPGGGVSFHHHEVVGAKLVAKRLRALRFDKDTVQAVARLTELHLRFHGYGEQAWTDSAVRRYVTDAGPLLERLHRLTRSDSTTRNRRKADQLSFAYDDLEDRIGELREKEELASIRPDLDGTQIMAILGIGPGVRSARRTASCSSCAWSAARRTRPTRSRHFATGGRPARSDPGGHASGDALDHQQAHVVVVVGAQRVDQVITDRAGAGARRSGGQGHVQGQQPLAQSAVPALDEAVGERHERRADRQVRLGLCGDGREAAHSDGGTQPAVQRAYLTRRQQHRG